MAKKRRKKSVSSRKPSAFTKFSKSDAKKLRTKPGFAFVFGTGKNRKAGNRRFKTKTSIQKAARKMGLKL